MNVRRFTRAIAFCTAALVSTAHAATVDWSTVLTRVDASLVQTASTCQFVSSDGNYVFATTLNAMIALSPLLQTQWIVPPDSFEGKVLTCLPDPTSGFYIAHELLPHYESVFDRRDSAGVLQWRVRLPFVVRTIHRDSRGAVYVTDRVRRYAKISPGGAFVYNVQVPPGSFPAVTVDRHLDKLVLISSDNKLYVVNDAGVAEPQFSLTPTFVGGNGNFRDLHANADGFLVAGRTNGLLHDLVAFARSGAIRFRRSISTNNNRFAMQLKDDGTLLIIDEVSLFITRRERLASNGGVLESVEMPSVLIGLEQNASGRLGRSGDLVAVTGANGARRLQRISSAGQYSERLIGVELSDYVGWMEGFGVFGHLRGAGSLASFTDALELRAEKTGIATDLRSLTVGSVSIDPSGTAVLSTPEVSSPNTVFQVDPLGHKISAYLSLEGRPIARLGGLMKPQFGYLTVYHSLSASFSLPVQINTPQMPVFQAGRARVDGKIAVGLEYVDGSRRDCKVVIAEPPPPEETGGNMPDVRTEPCGVSSVTSSFRLLGSTNDAYFSIANKVLRARSFGGELLWQRDVGHLVSTPLLSESDDLAHDNASIYVLSERSPQNVDLQKFRRDNGQPQWETPVQFPGSGGPYALAGPFFLGQQVANVIKAGAATFVVFHSSETGLQTATIPVDANLRAAFARKIPGRHELIIGGNSGVDSGSDARLIRLNNTGVVLNDEVLVTEAVDRVMNGEVLDDGSVIVAGQAAVGSNEYGLVSRLRLTPKSSQTSIVSLSSNAVPFGSPVLIVAAVSADNPQGSIRVDGRRGQFCTAAVPQGSCVIEPNTAGAYRFSARYSGDAFNSPSVSSNVFMTVSGSADLSVRFDGLPRVTTHNGAFTYELVLRNLSGHRVAGARVSHAAPPGVEITSWTCVPTTESFCGEQVSGTGSLNAAPLVNVGDEIRYRLEAIDRAREPEIYPFSASVEAPPGVTDPLVINNEATGSAIRAVFANGFD
jgi:hypothetical protein